jgi:hypothetical protein
MYGPKHDINIHILCCILIHIFTKVWLVLSCPILAPLNQHSGGFNHQCIFFSCVSLVPVSFSFTANGLNGISCHQMQNAYIRHDNPKTYSVWLRWSYYMLRHFILPYPVWPQENTIVWTPQIHNSQTNKTMSWEK